MWVSIGVMVRMVKSVRKSWLRILGIVVECSLVLFILSACSPGPEVSAETPPAETPDEETEREVTYDNLVPLGQPHCHDDLEVRVLEFELRQVIGDGSQSIQAESGTTFAVVSLQIKNVGPTEESRSYNTIDFAVMGDKEEVYKDWQTDIVYEISQDGRALRSGKLYGGRGVTGIIVRTIDVDDSHLVLRWSTGPRGWLNDSNGAVEYFFALE